jgi:hydrogenase nickel incorporation protein HypA/HybF
MHELSIAQNILEIVRAQIKKDDLVNVRSVKLRVGAISGVVPHSLTFSFDALVADTALRNARLEIEFIPFVIKCSDCSEQSDVDYGIALCPSCGSGNTTIISGNELDISEIILQDIPVEHQ